MREPDEALPLQLTVECRGDGGEDEVSHTVSTEHAGG